MNDTIDMPLLASVFRAAAQGALAPEKAYRLYQLEQTAKGHTATLFIVDKEQDAEFMRAKTMAGIFNAIADIFANLATCTSSSIVEE